MTNELYHLYVSLKVMTKENARITKELALLKDRNTLLEEQLVDLENV